MGERVSEGGCACAVDVGECGGCACVWVRVDVRVRVDVDDRCG